MCAILGLGFAANWLVMWLPETRIVMQRRILRSAKRKGYALGGYGLLLAGGTVDELIYSEIGNEVLLIKYVDSAVSW